jgi:hypothetical protein
MNHQGASYWWAKHYARLKDSAAESGMVETIQLPGDLIYVPQGVMMCAYADWSTIVFALGWWHAVINIDPWTVAVTHNLVWLRT